MPNNPTPHSPVTLKFLRWFSVLSGIVSCLAFAATVDSAPKRFDVAAGLAESALKDFSAQSGVEIVFASSTAGRARTNSVHGEYAPREALNRMLEGTGLIVEQAARTGALIVARDPNALKAVATNTPPAGETEPTMMTPFLVSTSGDTGYLAQNSLAGSRLNTKLSDLAAPVTVFTEIFLEDIASTSTDDLLNYMSSTRVDYRETTAAGSLGSDPTTDGATFRIRGLLANPSINFFPTILRLDHYNTERIEQSRGPNSILFGVGSPGGLVNITTKRAQLRRSFGSLTFVGRQHDGLRTALDYNQAVIDGRLAVRVAAVRDDKESWRHHERDNQQRLFLTSTWQMTPRTQLTLEGERGRVEKERVYSYVANDAYTLWAAAGKRLSNTANPAAGIANLSNAVYFALDTATGRVMNWSRTSTSVERTIDGISVGLTDFSLVPKEANVFGVGFPQNTDYSRAAFFLTHSFTPNFNVELAGNYSKITRSVLTGGAFQTLSVDTNVTLPTGAPNPNAGRAYLEGFPVRQGTVDNDKSLRLTMSYEKDLGRIFGRHRIAILGESDWTRQRRSQEKTLIEPLSGAVFNPAPENGANTLRFRSYVDVGGPAEAIAVGDWRKFDLTNITDEVSGRAMRVTRWFSYSPNAGAYNRFELNSAMAVLQSRFLNERLITVAGVRKDWQDARYSPTAIRGDPFPGFASGEYIVLPGNEKIPLSASNRTFGAVFHATSWLSLTYNNARNIALPSRNAALPTETGRAPSPKGRSYDTGFKLNFGEKLYLSAQYFETSAQRDFQGYPQAGQPFTQYINPLWLALDAAGVQSPDGKSGADHQEAHNGDTFDWHSKGYEFELIANPTRNWRLFFNYSDILETRKNLGQEMRAYVEKFRDFWLSGTNGRVLLDGSGGLAPVANDGSAVINTVAKAVNTVDQYVHDTFIVPEGERPRGQVRHRFNLRANYTVPEGILRGFSGGGGMRYEDGQVTAFNPATRSVIQGRSNTLFDANVGYRRNVTILNRKIGWRLQLNVNNLLDETKILPMRMSSAGEIINYRLQAPRELIVTSKFDF